jgi:ubiquinone biosynthesis protein
MARNAKRFETIVRTFAKYGLANWIRDWNPDFVKDYFKGVDGKPIAELPREERIRLAFTELGTTFIKLGQVLSTRSDVIGVDSDGWSDLLSDLSLATQSGTLEISLAPY